MRALTWRAAVAVLVAAVLAGACGSGDGGGGDGEADGLRKLPLGAVGSGRSSATMAAEADASLSRGAFAPVEYRLADDADAGDVPRTATAYEVRPLDADEVRTKVGKALDVDPERIEVGAGGYDWYYSSMAPDTAVSSPSSSSSASSSPPEPPPTVPGVPSAEDAEGRMRDVLEALGASDEGRFETFGEDGYNRTVVFTPSVDGVPVLGLQTQVAFGGEGRIEYANGLFAEVEAIGDYPLVGLAEAVRRLQDGFGPGGGVRTMASDADADADATTATCAAGETCTDRVAGSGGGASGSTGTSGTATSGSSGSAGASTGTATAEPDRAAGSTGSAGASTGTATAEPATDPACAPDEPCSTPPAPPADQPTMTIEPQPMPTVPLEPQVVEVTGAELTLQLVAAGCPGDPVYLVPSFELQPDAGSVIAVEDDLVAGLDPGDRDDPAAEPCPDQSPNDVPAGKPEPAPMPADTGREPANP